MDSNAGDLDPWGQTLGLLALLSGVANAHAESLVNIAHKANQRVPVLRVQPGPGSVVAKIVERASPGTITVAWRDPTSCRYGDQIWRASVAREPGVCALSGKPITPGDAVFEPKTMRKPALNAGAMILCSAVGATA
ncbi:MAG: hypothetical protein QOH33_1281 [Paraburkholderia sp.]|nr:hypothetical protein [Paraburkholderia sp.]